MFPYKNILVAIDYSELTETFTVIASEANDEWVTFVIGK